jgi:Tol biopolymer transport system component
VMNIKRDTDRRFLYASSAADTGSFQQNILGEFSFLKLSPDQKKIALVRNTRSMIVIKKDYIEPFDMTYSSGDIEIATAGEKYSAPLSGAADVSFVEDMPSWSPDGKKIIFVRYVPIKTVNTLNPITIYTIAYNDGKGGVPEPLMQNPPSEYCYFPQYSPDGAFVSFVSGYALKGYFARNSSSIWLYHLKTKTLKKMNLNAAGTMNSWHVWSADGQWIVFSSKRNKNNLTSLYCAKVDSDGTDYPAVEIAFDEKYKTNLPVLIPETGETDYLKKISGFAESIWQQQ